MNPLSASAQQALEHFKNCQQWEQRARLVLQYGAQLEELPEAARNPEALIHGCETRVWLVLDQSRQPPRFQVASEARLLRGLLALLLLRIEGLSVEQMAALDITDWFQQLGLGKQLSPSRSNGLNAVLKAMRHLLEQAAAAEA